MTKEQFKKTQPKSSLGPPPPNPYANKQAAMPEPPSDPTEDQIRRVNEVKKYRDALYEGVVKYRSILQDTTLPSNRTKAQNDERTKLFEHLNTAHGDLQQVNVGEAPLALDFLALNCILGLQDQINELKFQNTMLHKKLKEAKVGD